MQRQIVAMNILNSIGNIGDVIRDDGEKELAKAVANKAIASITEEELIEKYGGRFVTEQRHAEFKKAIEAETKRGEEGDGLTKGEIDALGKAVTDFSALQEAVIVYNAGWGERFFKVYISGGKDE